MNDMTTFYLVRHGQTEWNVKGLIQGTSDSPLTKDGINQAKELAKQLSHVEFDLIFSSDLLRAKKTAEIIVGEKNLAMQTTKLLRERNFGPLEGKSSAYFKEWDEALKMLAVEERYSYRHLDIVESDKDVIERFLIFISELAVRYPGKNILAVTHGGIMRTVLNRLGKLENFARHGAVGNGAYVKILTDGKDIFVKEIVGIKFDDQ